MTLSEIVSVTGMSGLYRAGAKRSDGLIATSLVDGSTKFISGRVHLFSTLDNITIYTQEGSKELREILAAMKANEAKLPIPDGKNDEATKVYFEAVIPDYDHEKFYISHMKKLIGWYKILNDKGLIAELTTEKTTAEETTDADSDATDTKKTDKPIAEKSTKPKKETKPHIEKTSKASSRVAGGGARKTVTPRKAS